MLKPFQQRPKEDKKTPSLLICFIVDIITSPFIDKLQGTEALR